MPLHHYAITLLRHYAITPLHHYTITPLRHYAIMQLRHYAITPLRHYAITPLCHYAITPYAIMPNAITSVCSVLPLHHYAITPLCCYVIMPYCHYTILMVRFVKQQVTRISADFWKSLRPTLIFCELFVSSLMFLLAYAGLVLPGGRWGEWIADVLISWFVVTVLSLVSWSLISSRESKHGSLCFQDRLK